MKKSADSTRRARPDAPHPGGTIRIIGGQWRGTRLPVADREGLRPSSDRVRETLFNWLQPKLPGARVLDLFAGTGALGLEAVSRGAAEAVLIERDPPVAERLRAVASRLQGGERVEIVQADALSWLRHPSDRVFDLVFVDPPFDSQLYRPALDALPAWLSEEAWLYLESPRDAMSAIGTHWLLHREGSTRDVRYALYRPNRQSGQQPADRSQAPR